MQPFVGIDFGTTNSAVAVAGAEGPPRLLGLPNHDGPPTETWRSVLFFEPSEAGPPDISAGGMAIGRYLDSGGDGRFIQSVKSHLASRLFSKTNIVNRNYGLEDLVAIYLRRLRSAVDFDLGDSVVMGRPVRYWGAESEQDDERALARMVKGCELAGFKHVVFEHEPTAAAATYRARLQSEELILIADFGGGTSDFCLLEIGPDNEGAILATGGLGVGGDTFDGCIIDSMIAPLLGKGTAYRDAFGSSSEVPASLYHKLRRWHHLAFLKSRKTAALLERILTGAAEPEKIERFIHVVEHDLGLPLHRAIEGTKVCLSSAAVAELRFEDKPIAVAGALVRDTFESWIKSDLDRVDGVLDDVLRSAGVTSDRVGRVFATGGSSFVPAVRERLATRFSGRLDGGGELTSVAWGLAERARRAFG